MRNHKIIPPDKLAALCNDLDKQNAVIVFTNGIFDLLHPGHVQCLAEARGMGSHLMVGVNSDESVRRIKGKDRPIVTLEARLEVLSAFEAVSFATWFDEDTPEQIIQLIRPRILVKGGDWKSNEIVGKDFVESYGGKVLTIPYHTGYSTTNIIEKILKL